MKRATALFFTCIMGSTCPAWAADPTPPVPATPAADLVPGLNPICASDAASAPPVCLEKPDPAALVAAPNQATSILNSRARALLGEATVPQGPSPALIANALIKIDNADVYARCVQRRTDAPADIQVLIAQVAAAQAALRSEFLRACGTQAKGVALRFQAEARSAPSLADSKLALGRVKAAAAQAAAARFREPNAVQQGFVDETVEAVTRAQHEVALREGAADTICGKDSSERPKAFCVTYGAFGATLSYLWTWNHSQFSTRPRLTSIVVPTVAARWEPWSERGIGWLALELGAYTSFLTDKLTSASPTGAKIACTQNASDYETRLPCEANGVVSPYMAGYIGATVGKSGVGFLTLAPLTFGVAQVGSRTALEPYLGFMVGALQFNGKF